MPLLAWAFVAAGCTGDEPASAPAEPFARLRYYRTAQLDSFIPVVSPDDQVQFDAAQALSEVYLATFDDAGRLESLELQRQRKTEWLKRYVYDDAGIPVRRETIGRDRKLEVEDAPAEIRAGH